MPPAVSAAGERIYARLAAYHQGDEENGWILLHACEARARMSARTQALLRHDQIGSGRRRAHDPARAPAFYLPRLRDLAGNADDGLAGDELRAAIAERPRAARCTAPALIADVLRVLTPDAVASDVRVLERQDSPYRFLVLTRTAQTPDAVAGRSPAVLRVVRRHEPLFCIGDALVDDSPVWDEATLTWDQIDPSVTWDNVQLQDVT